MKTSLTRSLLLAVGLMFGCLAASASAAETTNQATVLKIVGTGSATMSSGGGAPQTLSANTKVPQGATITTGAGVQVYIEVFPGGVSTVGERTSVSLETLSTTTSASGAPTKQTARLNLKSGSVVSTLDPSKRGVNDYSISTPKGVAAARGTSLTVNVAGTGDVTITANADTVQFTTSTGTYTISNGKVLITLPPVNGVTPPPQVVTLASIAAGTSGLPASVAQNAKDAVQAGVTAMATVLHDGMGNLSKDDSTNLAAQVLAAAVQADPTTAAQSANTIVNGMTGSGTQATNNNSEEVAKVLQLGTQSLPDTDRTQVINGAATLSVQNGVKKPDGTPAILPDITVPASAPVEPTTPNAAQPIFPSQDSSKDPSVSLPSE